MKYSVHWDHRRGAIVVTWKDGINYIIPEEMRQKYYLGGRWLHVPIRGGEEVRIIDMAQVRRRARKSYRLVVRDEKTNKGEQVKDEDRGQQVAYQVESIKNHEAQIEKAAARIEAIENPEPTAYEVTVVRNEYGEGTEIPSLLTVACSAGEAVDNVWDEIAYEFVSIRVRRLTSTIVV